MKTSYTHLSEEELVWKDNVRHVRRRIDEALSTLRDSLVNEALHIMDERFMAAKKEGKILRVGQDPIEIALAIVDEAQKFAALETGD